MPPSASRWLYRASLLEGSEWSQLQKSPPIPRVFSMRILLLFPCIHLIVKKIALPSHYGGGRACCFQCVSHNDSTERSDISKMFRALDLKQVCYVLSRLRVSKALMAAFFSSVEQGAFGELLLSSEDVEIQSHSRFFVQDRALGRNLHVRNTVLFRHDRLLWLLEVNTKYPGSLQGTI